MLIGVPTEIKNNEFRVGLTPESVAELVHNGHQVIIQSGAGLGIGEGDLQYRAAGAQVVADANAVFDRAQMIIKVKEPQSEERGKLKAEQVLFTYLHLAPDPEQTVDLINSGATCIAYETVTDNRGGLPLLSPMSQVAGRMAVHAGATALEKSHGGRGVLIGGVPGVKPAKVVILGGGVVGFNAAQMATGMQANVTILDRNPQVINRLSEHFGSSANILYSTRSVLQQEVLDADLVIGAVLVPGAAAPKLVSRALLKNMREGAVLVDVAIDQGGCFETSRATTHADPTFIVDGVVHYCVANMPGGVARTSTYALNNATLPYTLALANKGWKRALAEDEHLRNGLNVWNGKITCEPVARDLQYDYVPADMAVAA